MSESFTVPIPWFRVSISIVALITLIILYFASLSPVGTIAVFLIGGSIGASYFGREAIEFIIKRRWVNTDVLMLISVIGAAVISEFIAAITLIFLYSMTETLESYTVRRTKTSINSLMKLAPTTTTIIVEGTERDIPLSQLQVNDIVKIVVGDTIPTDGIVLSGNGLINEFSLTGENIPIYKGVDDRVIAGTSCVDGTISFKVTNAIGDNTISKIIELVESAQSRKMPAQLIISRFTKYFMPLILIVAILIFVIGFIITGEYTFWLNLSITFLVASSPCALAISTPVTVYSAISSLAHRGILVKGGLSLQNLAGVNGVAFDKTGTLTYGEPELTDIIISENYSEESLLQIAGTIESHTNHPLAKAVVKEMLSRGLSASNITNIQNLPGQGVQGIIDGEKWFVGYTANLSKNTQTNQFHAKIEEFKTAGKSFAFLEKDDTIIGLFAFRDEIRTEIPNTIQRLHQDEIVTFILTGDRKESAFEVASEIGIPENRVFYEMLPEDKLNKIERLSESYHLAMVGDGINDGPALALADVGIAMGSTGTDVALETADVAIMGDNLSKLRTAIEIGKRMNSIIKQNIVLSTIILVGLLIAVLLGEINMTQSILIHEGTEVLIVANAMKLFLQASRIQ